MIYIPTLTSKLRYTVTEEYENVLYSPNKNITQKLKGKNITIWDNYTFYLYRRLQKNKQQTAKEHYIWLVNYIKENWEKGITLITPDVFWLQDRDYIEKLWLQNCKDYPQLYVPNTWKNDISKLNIVGHALTINSKDKDYHRQWTHCLGHKRNNIVCELLTYDKVVP